MTEIKDLTKWMEDYFSKKENQEKAAKACEHYDRLMVKQLKKQLSLGKESINIHEMEINDPGKTLEKAQYETISPVFYQGVKGKLRINMLEQTAEFLHI